MYPAFIHANYYAECAVAVFQPKGVSILNVFSYQNTKIKGEVCNFCITTVFRQVSRALPSSAIGLPHKWPVPNSQSWLS